MFQSQTLVLQGCGDESRGSKRNRVKRRGGDVGGGGGGRCGSRGVGHVTSCKTKMLFLIENKMSLSHTQAKCFFSFFMRRGLSVGEGHVTYSLTLIRPKCIFFFFYED